jgi:dUTP pyrophosphatase
MEEIVEYNAGVEFGVYLAHPDAVMPKKANPNDAGFDLSCIEDVHLLTGERKVVSTGVHFKLSPGWEIQVRPRSGNAAKLGLTIVNTPGTIDADYTGEVKVILLNTSNTYVNLPKGSKIAQLVFQKVPSVNLKQILEMPTNEVRGTAGFGSTDKKS